MYIEPNSIIKIYHNVPLDNTYNHTIYFNNIESQNSYFHASQGIVKYTLTNQSYQRVVKGRMRIAIPSDDLYDCNYLCFQNTSFGLKWFYAFINSVEYINNNTSEISFEIDAMQTYMFDVELKQCFVEREHSSSDNIGDNIKPESFDVGDYVQNGESIRALGSEYSRIIIIATSYDADTKETIDGTLLDNCYQGVYFKAFIPTVDDPSGGANAWLKQVTDDAKEESIVGIFMCPSYLYPTQRSGTETNLAIGNIIGSTIDGYTPKNKKLFTSPYNLLYATTGDGKSTYYRFEYFNSPTNINFALLYSLSCNPEVTLVAKGYKKNRTNGLTLNKDIDNSLSLNNFPMCSYTIDSFRAWLAQSKYSLPLSIGSDIASGALSIATGNVLSGARAGLSIANTVSNVLTASLLPPKTRGNTTSHNTFWANNIYDFWISRKSVNSQMAKVIDDYFSYYGYSCGELKIPNRNVRPHWTYTKTNGCVVEGNAPVDDINKICKIYDNGITFWNNPSEVGNYSLDNSPS